MDQVALGKRIKAARERVGMTQEDLAAAVDYSVDHVSVVERGREAAKAGKAGCHCQCAQCWDRRASSGQFERGDDAPSHGALRAFEDTLPRRAAQGDECAGRIDHRIPVTV